MNLQEAITSILNINGIDVLLNPSRVASYVRDLCNIDVDVVAAAFVRNCDTAFINIFVRAAREESAEAYAIARSEAREMLREQREEDPRVAGELITQLVGAVKASTDTGAAKAQSVLEMRAKPQESKASQEGKSVPLQPTAHEDARKALQDELNPIAKSSALAKLTVAAIAVFLVLTAVGTQITSESSLEYESSPTESASASSATSSNDANETDYSAHVSVDRFEVWNDDDGNATAAILLVNDSDEYLDVTIEYSFFDFDDKEIGDSDELEFYGVAPGERRIAYGEVDGIGEKMQAASYEISAVASERAYPEITVEEVSCTEEGLEVQLKNETEERIGEVEVYALGWNSDGMRYIAYNVLDDDDSALSLDSGEDCLFMLSESEGEIPWSDLERVVIAY